MRRAGLPRGAAPFQATSLRGALFASPPARRDGLLRAGRIAVVALEAVAAAQAAARLEQRRLLGQPALDLVEAAGAPGPGSEPGRRDRPCRTDRDGDLDLFVANFAYSTGPLPQLGVFRNDGNGYFEDLSDQYGISVSAYTVVFGDVDNDGDTMIDMDDPYCLES